MRNWLLSVLCVLPVLSCAPRSAPIHVVVFLIDTLRADRMGVYGYPRTTTPGIDALAESSVVFERAHAAAPWTVPSTVSLMTSRFSCEHGVVVDGQKLDPRYATLAEKMREAGYQTASFYTNPYANTQTGLDRGFDHSLQQRGTNGEKLGAWLDEHESDRPWFIYIHNGEPHDPYFAPDEIQAEIAPVKTPDRNTINRTLQEYRRLTRSDFTAKQPRGTTDNTEEQLSYMEGFAKQLSLIRDLYDGDVREADLHVATTIEALERRGLWRNTLFIVLSDHGEEFGEHGGWQHDQSVYEELLRVPLIMRLPGDRHAGQRIFENVSLVDLYPTILAVIGHAELAEAARGRNLLGLLESETRGASTRPRISSMRDNRKKYFKPAKELRGDVNVVVREGNWKAIWNAEPDTLELYDLDADPGETTDVARLHPERAETLREQARQWLTDCRARAAAPGDSAPMSDETKAGLRALGYLE